MGHGSTNVITYPLVLEIHYYSQISLIVRYSGVPKPWPLGVGVGIPSRFGQSNRARSQYEYGMILDEI